MRLPALLLLAVQLIAPFWHVCELSGKCGECKPQNGTLSCHTPREAKSEAAPRCAECKTQRFVETDSRPDRFKGTCLARELMSMGRVAVAPLTLNLQVRRVRAARLAEFVRRAVPSLRLVPSRGPPVSV
jgi:hypothetical protein